MRESCFDRVVVDFVRMELLFKVFVDPDVLNALYVAGAAAKRCAVQEVLYVLHSPIDKVRREKD